MSSGLRFILDDVIHINEKICFETVWILCNSNSVYDSLKCLRFFRLVLARFWYLTSSLSSALNSLTKWGYCHIMRNSLWNHENFCMISWEKRLFLLISLSCQTKWNNFFCSYLHSCCISNFYSGFLLRTMKNSLETLTCTFASISLDFPRALPMLLIHLVIKSSVFLSPCSDL